MSVVTADRMLTFLIIWCRECARQWMCLLTCGKYAMCYPVINTALKIIYPTYILYMYTVYVCIKYLYTFDYTLYFGALCHM